MKTEDNANFLSSWPFHFLHTSEEGLCLFILLSLYPGFRVKISKTGSKIANSLFNQLHLVFVLDFLKLNKLHQDL